MSLPLLSTHKHKSNAKFPYLFAVKPGWCMRQHKILISFHCDEDALDNVGDHGYMYVNGYIGSSLSHTNVSRTNIDVSYTYM